MTNNKFITKNMEVNPLGYCHKCKHRLHGTLGCAAYDEIPNEILLGEIKHNTIYKNQKGKFIFEEKGE